MSLGAGDSSESLIIVAKAVRTRGLKGEVVADLLTDFPERFEEIESLVAVAADGHCKSVDLESFWFQNDRVVLKFVGCDDVDAAKEFVGCQFGVDEADRVELSDGEYYDFELEGCNVVAVNGAEIGTVRAVLKTGGTEILEIKAGNKEVLVPLAESIVVEIDIVEKRIVIDPPEGLLDL